MVAFERSPSNVYILVLYMYIWQDNNTISRSTNDDRSWDLLITCKTSKVVAVIAWHVIPCVSMLRAKSVHTVFVFPVVGLLWSPESKTTYFFVCPNKRTFHTSIIESYPGPLSVMAVLNVNVLFLVVDRHQLRTHDGTIWFSSYPWSACLARQVAITTIVTPSWLAYICRCKEIQDK